MVERERKKLLTADIAHVADVLDQPFFSTAGLTVTVTTFN